MKHGHAPSIQAHNEAKEALAKVAKKYGLPTSTFALPPVGEYRFMFPGLQDNDSNLLPVNATTLAALDALGAAMAEPAGPPAGTSTIPAAYTYLGQFIDHDLTLEFRSGSFADIASPTLAPLPKAQILQALENGRTPSFDLDCVYGPEVPFDTEDSDKLLVGQVQPVGQLPPGVTDPFHDVPRLPPSATDPVNDRRALIGDARNDEKLIIAQLQVAFLRAHNAIVDLGHDFTTAQQLLRQHYQWIVLTDFLPRIVDEKILRNRVRKGNRFYRPGPRRRMPLEFAVAAYRFGHSMIRARYDHNVNFPNATLSELFTFTALSGNNFNLDTLPQNWIIQWEKFVPAGIVPPQPAAPIDTLLVEPLMMLPDTTGAPLPPPVMRSLAVRNLRRGYMLRLPTGQAVAKAIGVPPLTPPQLLAAAGNNAQRTALNAGGFTTATPLWYYVLAEAKHVGTGKLGPVGSTIVVEVFVALLRRSQASILKIKGWKPTLGGTPGTFALADLLRLAKVL